MRYCEQHGEAEERELQYGMDYRKPRYRREVFLRFYEFHLKHKSHPGAVYYVMPHLSETLGWDAEQRLWFAYINGNTQHPVSSYVITQEFPSVHTLDMTKLRSWFTANYERLEFDTDRRYHKKGFLEAVENYRQVLRGKSQQAFFSAHYGDTEEESFRRVWRTVIENFFGFGRLSTFSYCEYLRINGVAIKADQLFLDDIGGSKSHRNGLAKVLGRDDLDWHDSNPAFDGKYSPELMRWLKEEGKLLLADAVSRFRGREFEGDVGNFTLESALCTYKSWHRPNRRYPNVYNDLFYERIIKSETRWGTKFPIFWDARKRLPAHLLLERTPNDPGCVPEKQNHYLTTGQPIMMHKDWPCFQNAFNDKVGA